MSAMQKNKPISDVFNYTTPISLSQIAQRSFVDRLKLKDKLEHEVLRDSVLFVSGYSSVGKTSLVNLVTDKKYLRSVGAPYISSVSVFLNNISNGEILKNIYNEIFEFTNGKKIEAITPTSLANLIHTNRLLVIIDGINNLYNEIPASKELYSLCKSWTDMPKGAIAQSKIILVASGFSDLTDKWIYKNSFSARLPHEHIPLPAWDSADLLKIVEVGANHIGATFDIALQNLMVKVACGLPSTMTLLAHIISRHANNDQNVIQQENIKIDSSDLRGVFGESKKFEQVLYNNQQINTLSTPALLSLYALGIHGGRLPVSNLHKLLEACEIDSTNALSEIADLTTTVQNHEEPILNINELSYGTFAFLRLHHRTKLNVPNAQQIIQALYYLNNFAYDDLLLGQNAQYSYNNFEPLIDTERNRQMTLPEQQIAWTILQQAFSFITDELKQRWKLAREKKEADENQKEQNGNVSQQIQDKLHLQLKASQNETLLRSLIDDLKTSLRMAEDYNRIRNKYRQQLPSTMDSARIEILIEDNESKRDQAIKEIKEIFEKIIQEEIEISAER